MNWYRLNLLRGHLGAGKKYERTAYVFADNIVSVLRRFRKMPGVKRTGKIPLNIYPLGSDETHALEEEIIMADRISLNKAKKTWYYRCV